MQSHTRCKLLTNACRLPSSSFHPPNLICPPTPSLDQAKGNDKGSSAFHLPSDDALVYWVREKLDMKIPPGPTPAPPQPLPPAPPAHFPDTCAGDCFRAHQCCSSLDIAGCSKPTCVMGCEIAKVMLPHTL
jgi:hypothetical protein